MNCTVNRFMIHRLDEPLWHTFKSSAHAACVYVQARERSADKDIRLRSEKKINREGEACLSSMTEVIQEGLLSFIKGSSCCRPMVLNALFTLGHS